MRDLGKRGFASVLDPSTTSRTSAANRSSRADDQLTVEISLMISRKRLSRP
jgi:hypothetical protein